MLINLFERPAQSKKREGIRELSADEIFYIGGGDDPGDSGGCDGSCGDTSASSDTGISDSDAQALVSNINLAFTDPVMAFALFVDTLVNAVGNLPDTGVTFSNPMGDGP